MKSANQIPDQIFADSLVRLQNGETAKAIAKSFPDHQQELEGLLLVAQSGINISKLSPPAPYKAYRFADQVAATQGFMEWMPILRMAIVPICLVIILVGGGSLANATNKSVPGDKLFSLKRATEEARLTLTLDPDKVAAIHVELLNKRLDEVRQAVESKDETRETLAIAELQSQTEQTFAVVPAVATANAITRQDSTLLDTLVAVSKEQKDVLASLSETTDNAGARTVADTALEGNKKNDKTLAKIIATVNDQALVDMPNKVSITGTITFYNGDKITVEKNIFNINDRTTITGIDGQAITDTDAKTISGRVSIIGTRVENGSLVAKQILLLAAENDTDEDGTVKGDVDVAPLPTGTTTPPPVETPVQPTTPPTKASGSFITEPSSRQYTP